VKVVDAQVHIWKPESPARPWVEGAKDYAHGESFSDDQLIARMDAAGVDMAVLVPPSWEGNRNDACLEARERRPDRFLVMGRIDLTSPLSDAQLEDFARDMAGLRLTFRRDPDVAQLTGGQASWLLDAAERLSLPIAIYAPTSLDRMDELARQHPGLKLVIDHLGLPLDARDDAARRLVDDVCRLSVHPNVALKASCLPNNFREQPPFPSIAAVVHEVVDAFGYERVFWGSDISRLPADYAELVSFFVNGAGGLEGAAREGVLGASLLAWLDRKAK
jgi:L-fuconolactonase